MSNAVITTSAQTREPDPCVLLARLRSLSKRLLALYLLTVMLCSVMFAYMQYQSSRNRSEEHRFERQIINNCVHNNQAVEKFHKLLDAQQNAVAKSTVLDPVEKKLRIDNYRTLYPPINVCPAEPK